MELYFSPKKTGWLVSGTSAFFFIVSAFQRYFFLLSFCTTLWLVSSTRGRFFFFPTLAHHTIPNGLCSVYSQRHRVSPGHDSPQRTPISKQAVKVSLPLPSEYLQQYVRDERARQQKHRAKIRSYEKCPPPRSHVDNMMATTHTTIIKQYLDTREKKHFPSHPHEGDKISEKNIFL